jgi:hypothetical protein
VANFTGISTGTPKQLSVNNYTATNSRGNNDDHCRPVGLQSAAQRLANYCGMSISIHNNWH